MNAKVKILIAGLLFVMACSGGSGDGDGEDAVTELSMDVAETGTIETVGDVDTYHLRVAETNRYLTVSCDEKTSGSGVDLMVTVFEEDENGERTRLFGKHKPLDATPPADIGVTLYIDEPKDLYITVRDVMDDDASQDIAYHLSCSLSESADGNHDFENAEALVIDGTAPVYDAIEEVGEVDCFTFSPEAVGVYSVKVAPASTYLASSIQLATSLYDTDGNRIQKVTDPDGTILSYLDPADGPFYVTVHDRDDRDADVSAVYGVTVASAEAGETMENDDSDAATVLTEDGGMFTADGEMAYASSSMSMDHEADVDWYEFTLADPSPATYQAVDLTISGDAGADASLVLRVAVYDENLNAVMSKDFYCGGDDYQNMFRAESGLYYVQVTPLNPNKLDRIAAYHLLLTPGDLTDDDDNTRNTAIPLTTGVGETGSIGYQADVDWYGLAVSTTSPQIVSVDLAGGSSVVDYQLSIWRGDTQLRKVSDLDGTDGDTHLKTSVYVPADITGSATYYFKVGDGQNDEGSDVTYTITASVDDVPGSVPDAVGDGSVVRYYDESDEQSESGGDYTEVELEIFSSYQPTYIANTDWLDFKAGTLPDGIEKTDQGDGTTLITFPWVAGYIDYQGDRDLFQLDFDKLTTAGSETEWYYDIQIRLVVPSGTDVEYVWKLYRDHNMNNIIMDDPTSDDGYKACDGDTTPRSQAAMDITTPTGDEEFWIGSDWGEDANFYFGVQDFEYEYLPDSGDPLEENPDPDDDWGYDAPYYFQLQLIYHPGSAVPE